MERTAHMARKISIIVPFFNEEQSVKAVLLEILKFQPDAEVIAVDDGSADSTWSIINSVDKVKGIRFRQNRGQSAAMLTGLKQASHDICVVMDGDGQNDPADIASMIPLMQEYDAVFGYRAIRKDTWDRRVASRIANRIRRMFIDDGIRDTGCSLKVFRKDMVEYLPPINGLHRFMGAFFTGQNFRIVEVPVNHRPRALGVSKYNNFDRAVRGIYDLVGVSWYLKRKVNMRAVEE
jgi:dolichol-phosphate mannosyltransferase